jgi:hypothetical protein
MAYLAAGVPPSRIFVINPAGDIRQGGCTYCWASYPRLLELAHQVFPPLDSPSGGDDAERHVLEELVADEFKTSNFWRKPMPMLAPPPEPHRPAVEAREAADRRG